VPYVAADLFGSSEYFASHVSKNDTFVRGLYADLLQRTPDQVEVDYWVSQVVARGRALVALDFYQSVEMRQRRVTALYADLLDRPPDAGGLSYWANRILAEGDLSLAVFLATSDEYLTNARTFALAG
jgi:hypothetical protein